MPARRLVSAQGSSFTGRGTAFRASAKRLRGMIIVIWDEGQSEPWIILVDLPPEEAGASWRAMRFWIETGFKALKSVGCQWQKTRRTAPAAAALTLATGSRAEDAQALNRVPGAPAARRFAGVFRLGLLTRLPPEPLPPPPDGVKVVCHPETPNLPLQALHGRRLG